MNVKTIISRALSRESDEAERRLMETDREQEVFDVYVCRVAAFAFFQRTVSDGNPESMSALMPIYDEYLRAIDFAERCERMGHVGCATDMRVYAYEIVKAIGVVRDELVKVNHELDEVCKMFA